MRPFLVAAMLTGCHHAAVVHEPTPMAVWVHYDGWDGHGMAGYFDARQDENLSPMIAIARCRKMTAL